MATNNAVNNGLSGSTGSALFVGSTQPTITTPTITGSILGPNAIASTLGPNLLTFSYTASAVNYFTMLNNSTGNQPTLTTAGSDPSISMRFQSNGGMFYFADNLTSAGAELRLYNADASQYTALKKADAGATSASFLVPDADGTADAPLITDGAGTLSFLTGPWTSFSGTIGYTGFSGTPTTNFALYKKIGRTVFINISMGGTSNATSFTITGLPFTCANANTFVGFQFCLNASANNICAVSIAGTTAILYFGTASNATGWTNSGAKNFAGSFFYETTT